MDKIEIYSEGIVHCSVCAEANIPIGELEAHVNVCNPTGIGSRWEHSSDETFRGGEINPCVCEDDPNRRHYLMVC